jgi:hypothetical protein
VLDVRKMERFFEVVFRLGVPADVTFERFYKHRVILAFYSQVTHGGTAVPFSGRSSPAKGAASGKHGELKSASSLASSGQEREECACK